MEIDFAEKKISRINLPVGIIFLIVIFIIDLLTPLGLAVGVLYASALAMVLRSDRKTVLVIAILISILIAGTPLIIHKESTSWMAYVNRGFSIIGIWILYCIITLHKSLSERNEYYLEKLKIRNKELKQFAYITSHDLQEPLRTINSFTHLLKSEYQKDFDEQANIYVNFIEESSERMSNLIKGLLDYSQIGRKKNKEEVDCNILVLNVIGDLNSAVIESGAIINKEQLPIVNGYMIELNLLFQNLISNAIKFRKNKKSPIISIDVIKKESYWEFSVKDNGIGIDEKYHKRVFTIFQRLHNKNDYEGTGIGLAHCKKIVELHNGNIWINSTLGEGTTFYFTIPY